MALSMDNKNRGMILSEILLAGAIISIALASVVIVVGGLQSMMINLQNGFEAELKAKQEISLAQLTNFNDLVSYQKIDGIFTTTFSVEYRNAFTTNVSVDVFWLEGSSKKHRIINDQIVDRENASGALDCDWLDNTKGNLVPINFGILNADDNNPITDISILGNFAYVSADGATSSLPDLYVVDVHDIKKPKIISHLNTGPGIASVAAAGHYVFAANAGSYQMQIVDVTDPTHPALVAQAKLPGAIISGAAGFGQSVHFFDNKMYVGLVKNAGPEFYVIDVHNPPSPIALGSYEIGSTVNDIDVQGSRATVVSPGQTSVTLLDISNPLVISKIDSISFDGWQTQGVQSVEMFGPRIVTGRTLGGFYSPYSEFMVLDRNRLSSTTASLKISASIENIIGFKDYIYFVTSDADKAFQIMTSTTLNVVMTTPLSSRGVSLTCNAEAMYAVTQNDQDFFHIYSLP